MKIKQRNKKDLDLRGFSSHNFCLHKKLTDLGSAQTMVSIKLFYNVFKKTLRKKLSVGRSSIFRFASLLRFVSVCQSNVL